MFPIQKILCPTDFSESSQCAIDVAKELAAYFRAELILLHVISDFPQPTEAIPTNFDIDGYKKQLIISSESSLREITSRIENNVIKVRSVALQGNPSDRIAKEARNEGVDLIVISSQSERGLKGLFFGSVTERAVRFTPCPVLIVPTYVDEKTEDVIAVPGHSVDQHLESQLTQLVEKLDAVEKGIEERKDGMDSIFLRRVAELEEKNEDVLKKIDRIKESSSEAWEEIKTGFTDLWTAFDKALSKFRSKKDGILTGNISDEKKAYEDRLDVLLSEWGLKIEILKEQIMLSPLMSKDHYMIYIGELKEKQRVAAERLAEFRTSGPEAMGTMKKSVDNAVEDLGRAIRDAITPFNIRQYGE
jgi:nucleotide-binding universal stress UspA family protein